MTKEEKAQEYIWKRREISDLNGEKASVAYHSYIAGYEAAENEAREKAVKAYQMTCAHHSKGLCVHRVEHNEWIATHECCEDSGCRYLKDFLKHYDDENNNQKRQHQVL